MKKKKPSGTGTKSGHKNAPADDSQKLPTEIQLLRTRVATSEAALKQAKEQAGQAKQRRKLAKLLAKKTRQDAQRAKTDLAKVRKTLARAEAALKSDAKAKKRAPKAVIPSVSKPAEKLSAAPRKPRTTPRGKSSAKASKLKEASVARVAETKQPVEGSAATDSTS